MTVTGKSLYFGVYVFENFSLQTPLFELVRRSTEEENMLAKHLEFKFKGGYYPLFYSPRDEYYYYNMLGSVAMKKFYGEPATLANFILFNAVGFWTLGRTNVTTMLNIAIGTPILLLFGWGIYIAKRLKLEYLQACLYRSSHI